NAAPGVLCDEYRVVPRRDDFATRAAHVARGNPAGGERQGAARMLATARLDRVAGVDREVDDDLLQLPRIRPDRTEIAVVMGLERDPRAEKAFHQLADFGNHV